MTIEDLGRECANEAFRAGGGTTDTDGKSLLPPGPIGGDWNALHDLLGRDPTGDEGEAFATAYRERLAELVAGVER